MLSTRSTLALASLAGDVIHDCGSLYGTRAFGRPLLHPCSSIPTACNSSPLHTCLMDALATLDCVHHPRLIHLVHVVVERQSEQAIADSFGDRTIAFFASKAAAHAREV